MVVKKYEPFQPGGILKSERLRLGYTREQIAERADIGVRYLTAIENDEKKPHINVLYRLIHSLGIPSDVVFYPEKTPEEQLERMRLIHLLEDCDVSDRTAVMAMVDALVDSRARQRVEQKKKREEDAVI